MSATLEHPMPVLAERRRPTLEQTLERAWRDALAGAAAECPVCHEHMELRGGQAECTGCGSRLS
jgi:hypothetical protein